MLEFLPLIFAGVLGAIFGSFGNVLILRLPEGKTIGGRSACPRCGRTIAFFDLIPVVSFLLLGGRCRGCKAPISWQYPLVELASGLLFMFAWWHEMDIVRGIVLALALWFLLLIAVTDLRTSGIPDAFNLPLVVLSVLYGFLAGASWWSGLLVGGGFFALQWIVSRGRWIGSGDIILGAGIGTLVGSWQLALLFVGLSYILGALVASILLLTGKKTKNDPLPFGPFLALGGFVTFACAPFLLYIFFGAS